MFLEIDNLVKKLILISLLVSPIVLVFLGKDYFDTGKSICFSQLLLEKECLGCGLTRGIMHLLHLDFKAAWEFNKLSFIILPFALLFWVHLLGKLINKPFFKFFDKLY